MFTWHGADPDTEFLYPDSETDAHSESVTQTTHPDPQTDHADHAAARQRDLAVHRPG